MTPEMIRKAQLNSDNNGYRNVEFRLGDIENLPILDDFIDVVISNCVINLVPDKKKVFKEILRSQNMVVCSQFLMFQQLASYLPPLKKVQSFMLEVFQVPY